MRKKQTENPLSVGHHCIRRFGYEVFPDGRIKLAPALADPMAKTLQEETGVKEMLNSVSGFAARQLAATAERRAEWWKEVALEISAEIVKGSGWQFNPIEQVLIPPKAGAGKSAE